jgi:uncharacterized integral membrane protein
MSDRPRDDETPEETTAPSAGQAAPAGQTPPPEAERGPGIPWGLTVALILALLLVVFAVQNTQTVALTFLGWEWRFPLVVIIVSVTVVSVVATELLGWVMRRRRARLARERQELKRLRSGH